MRVRALVAASLAVASLGCGGENSLASRPPRPADNEPENPRETAAWWVDLYGVIGEDDPRRVRTQAVFERVSVASERRSARQPRLILLDEDGQPFALALRDGSILLTRGGIDLCYRDRTPEEGDARLAFVLGHELAHLSENHFDHELAFSAADRAGLARTTTSGSFGRLLGDRKALSATRELEADTAALLAMTFAGYDPWILLGEKSFFAEWVDQAGTRIDAQAGRFTRGGHPSPSERAEYLIAQLTDVARQLPLFHFGTRLVAAGRLDDGILLLERFAERFPSREVLSNLGVGQARVALRALGRCDGALVSRLRLPLLLDQRTLAERTIRRGASSPCYERDDVRRLSSQATLRLEAAVARDPEYAPATLNLIAAYLLFDQPSRALTLAQEALARFPDDLDVQTAEAVALYAYGERNATDFADRALAKLGAVLSRDPRHGVALYDRAAILGERGRSAAADEAWRKFLEVEPSGIWAATARAWLGQPAPEVPARANDSVLQGDLHLGAGAVPAEIIATARREDFSIGDLQIETFRGPRVSLLRLAESTELIETVESLSQPEARVRFGDPVATERTARGVVWGYPGFALDFDETRTTLIRFAPARQGS